MGRALDAKYVACYGKFRLKCRHVRGKFCF